MDDSITSILVVDTFPLVIGIVLDINGTIDDWLTAVDEHESWDEWEHDTSKVTGETKIEHSVSLVRGPGLPKSSVSWGLAEWGLLLAKSWDFQVNSGAKLWLEVISLDHGNNLSLLLP